MSKTKSFIKNDYILYELNVGEDGTNVSSPILSALEEANNRLDDLEGYIFDTEDSIKKLTPECDKIDYVLAASSGALCGIIDVFLVGKPKESQLGVITDQWFANRTKDFATLNGWKPSGGDTLNSAIRFLERKFQVPYDQTTISKASKNAMGLSKGILSAKNHHFRSLGHNPTLLGVFYSIMNQFSNSASFAVEGPINASDAGFQKMILLTQANAKDGFELVGKTFISKLFCGIVNWFGHLISDISGSSSCTGRGMGIPSPLWTWINDIVVIKNKLVDGIDSPNPILINQTINTIGLDKDYAKSLVGVSDFDQIFNNFAVNIYTEGYDIRFQTAQTIPVFINELLTRLLYSTRRMVLYFSKKKEKKATFKKIWNDCEPFTNASVKRMLTVAHGTFCAIDTGDATARAFITGGGSFNPTEFFLRLNIIGLGRFTISLYGEGQRVIKKNSKRKELDFTKKEKKALLDYIEGLKVLADIYDDEMFLSFPEDFSNGQFDKGFEKSIQLAKKRGVPDNKIIKNQSDGDAYFLGGKC